MKLYRRAKFVHVPIDMVGWGIDLLALIFLLNAFVAIDQHSHSVSDTLYVFFLYAATTFLLLEWIAGKTDT